MQPCETIPKGTVNGEVASRADALQYDLIDEVDARRFLRMRSRFSWIGA